MDKQQARNLIKESFENPFDKDRFTLFIKNLLNRIEEAPFTYQGQYIPEAYRQYIRTLERIGKFNDDENRIDILIIKLQKETSLERARTMQRNFVAWYLNGSRGGELKDAALVAFVSPDEEDWRFSLVKMDYKFEQTKTGRIKVKEDFTPARRWSFLVGANENSHTAQSRLVNILANDEHSPTLVELEQAFDIETVTREFFIKYRELFIRTKEELDKVVKTDAKIKADFEAKGVNAVNFAKKLLGQIVFLYFLQKKGWFGVGRDAKWGTGSKHFLRELFKEKHGDYNNFFNDILEPLFYEALRIDRSHDDDYYSRFNCKVPFLNGGLFDPIGNNGGYDWVHTDIILSDSLFSNKSKTKEGDDGDGILDIFDRYNFTVKEDEPLEKEVAIDPELLGKAYEKFNAIRPDNFDEYKKALKSGNKGKESKFNKQYGVYYTPREIVHYMCQQSLINYLYTSLNDTPVSYEKLDEAQTGIFRDMGKKPQMDLTIEHRSHPIISKEDIEALIHTGEQVSENEEIALIKEQKINEGQQKTSDYKLKLPESIRKNASLIDQKLADITVCDPAVGSGAFPVGMMSEIVKARNVLSLFIKEENRTPYDFKRQCIEKSLYGVDIDSGAVEIAKLRLWLSLVVDEDDIKNIKPLPNLDYKIVCGNSLLGFPEGWDSPIANEIEALKHEFFNETNPRIKNELKQKIDEKINYRYSNSLKTLGYEVNFDFRTVFSEVFHSTSNAPFAKGGRGGFDVVIANPPYITYKGKEVVDISDAEVKKLISLYPNSAEYKVNSYALFTERGVNLLKKNGTLAYIIPSTILQNKYLKKIRKYLITKYHISQIVSFANKVFEAVTDSIILKVNNDHSGELKTIAIRKKDLDFSNLEDLKTYSSDKWTEANDFVINLKTNESEDEIISKIESGSTFLETFLEANIGIKRADAPIVNRPQSGYKKFLVGRNINKFILEFPDSYILFDQSLFHTGIDENIFKEKEKVLVRKTGNKLIAVIDDEKYYTDQSIYNLYPIKGKTVNLKVITALLNSPLLEYYFNKKMITNPDVFPYIKGIHLKKLPIKFPKNQSEEKQFETLVEKIIDGKKENKNTSKWEQQLNALVYKLYDLTPEEIEIVESINV